MPRDEQERAARGEGARQAAANNQAQAAGMRPSGGNQPPGFVPGSQAASDAPIRVQIVNGEDDFFEGIRKALGFGASTAAGSGGQNNPFQTNLKSQQAMTQAASQIAQDVKASMSMMKTLHMSNLQMNVQLSQVLKQLTTGQSSMLEVLRGGGGAGGHGGHGGGGQTYHDPFDNRFTSYGSIQGRMRAGAANMINDRWGANAPEDADVTPQQRQAATRISEGLAHGGVRGGLRQLRRLPGGLGAAGLAFGTLEATDEGAKFLTQQRAENARYQAIYDQGNVGNPLDLLGALTGNSQTSGLGNRVQEEGFVLGQRFALGGMTGDQARQTFQTASSLGYTGQTRQNALNFVSDSYRNMGMDPNQSNQLMQVASKYAITNLNGVYDSLMKVSQAAQLTGQSADTLRQTFIGNYQTALAGGAQGGAAGLAQAMTMATAAGGRSLQGFSYASMMQGPQRYGVAASVGMSPTQLEYQSAMGNYGPQASAMTKYSGMLMQSALGAQGETKLNQLVQQAGGAQKVAESPGTMSSIATQLLNVPGIDSNTIRSMLQASGMTIPDNASDEQMLNMIVNQYVGNTPEKAAQQQQAANAVRPVSQQELDQNKNMGGLLGGLSTGPFQNGPFASLVGDGHGMSDWLADQRRQQTNASSSFSSTMGHTIFGFFGGNDSSNSADAWGGTLDAYQDYSKKYGNIADPAMQKTIEQFGKDPSLRVRVRTKDGTDRAVSLAEAIKYYPDQISTGTASIMSNDADSNGKSLAELGITPSMQPGKLLQGEADTTTSGQEYGQSAKDQEKNFNPKAKQDDNKDSGGSQKVTIDFAPGAAQTLLRVVGTGAPNARPPAATGGPN